ncbi:hypothetical protein [Anaerotignum sp.]|nr:hypothetical protein [Anaerotignum sp.]
MRKIGLHVKPEKEVDESKALKKEILTLKKENAELKARLDKKEGK